MQCAACGNDHSGWNRAGDGVCVTVVLQIDGMKGDRKFGIVEYEICFIRVDHREVKIKGVIGDTIAVNDCLNPVGALERFCPVIVEGDPIFFNQVKTCLSSALINISVDDTCGFPLNLLVELPEVELCQPII